MGRTKSSTHSKPANKLSVTAEPSSSSAENGTKHSVVELLVRAEALLDQDNPELAIKFATKAQAQSVSEEEKCKCSEVMGMCCLELGQEAKAKRVSSVCS